MNTNKMLG